MEATRKFFRQAIEVYAALSRIQRASIAVASIGLFCVFVFFIAASTNESATMPLFDGRELSLDQLKSAENSLKSAGLENYERRGRRLFATASEFPRCVQTLSKLEAASTDSRSELEKQLEKVSGPFSRQQQLDEAREIALQNELRRIIRSINGIEDATVIWTHDRQRRIGRSQQPVTATVNVFPESGFQLRPSLVRSLQVAVANMVPGLDASRTVIMNATTGDVFEASETSSVELAHHEEIARASTAIAQEQPSQFVVTPDGAASDNEHVDSDGVAASTAKENAWPIHWVIAAIVIGVCAMGIRQRQQNESPLVATNDDVTPVDSDDEDHKADDSMARLAALESDSVDLSNNVRPQLEQPSIEPASSLAFDFLRRTSKERLSALIQSERPQTIAVILSHLPADFSTELLEHLPSDDEVEVLERMHQLDRVAPEAITAIRLSLKERINEPLPERPANSLTEVGSWRSMVSRESSDRLHESQLATRTGDRLQFDQILQLDDRTLNSLVRSIDRRQWTFALSGADAAIRKRVFEQLPVQESELLKVELQQLGPVRLSDVDAMQRRVTDRICELTGDALVISSEDCP